MGTPCSLNSANGLLGSRAVSSRCWIDATCCTGAALLDVICVVHGRPNVARRERAPPAVQQIVEESVTRTIQWAPPAPISPPATPHTSDGEHPSTRDSPVLTLPTVPAPPLVSIPRMQMCDQPCRTCHAFLLIIKREGESQPKVYPSLSSASR